MCGQIHDKPMSQRCERPLDLQHNPLDITPCLSEQTDTQGQKMAHAHVQMKKQNYIPLCSVIFSLFWAKNTFTIILFFYIECERDIHPPVWACVTPTYCDATLSLSDGGGGGERGEVMERQTLGFVPPAAEHPGHCAVVLSKSTPGTNFSLLYR